ncbi:MAG: carboxypeptidase-like regulatory domain-containing protein [Bacteroidota bacterium]
MIKNKDMQPIPYAHIYAKEQLKGCITNLNGEFTLTIKKDEVDTLVISHVGYVPLVISLEKAREINLNELILDYEVKRLNEIYTYPLSALETFEEIQINVSRKIQEFDFFKFNEIYHVLLDNTLAYESVERKVISQFNESGEIRIDSTFNEKNTITNKDAFQEIKNGSVALAGDFKDYFRSLIFIRVYFEPLMESRRFEFTLANSGGSNSKSDTLFMSYSGIQFGFIAFDSEQLLPNTIEIKMHRLKQFQRIKTPLKLMFRLAAKRKLVGFRKFTILQTYHHDKDVFIPMNFNVQVELETKKKKKMNVLKYYTSISTTSLITNDEKSVDLQLEKINYSN